MTFPIFAVANHEILKIIEDLQIRTMANFVLPDTNANHEKAKYCGLISYKDLEIPESLIRMFSPKDILLLTEECDKR